MDIQLEWQESFSTSCLHAAEALCHGDRLADQNLAAAITAATAQLQRELAAIDAPQDRMWTHLAALSATLQSHRQLAETTLAKVVGRGVHAQVHRGRLEACIAELEHAARGALPPQLDEQWRRHSGPLRAQWRQHGPGLMCRLKALTDQRVIPERAVVIVVHPALGGGGRAHLPYNHRDSRPDWRVSLTALDRMFG